MMLLYNQAARYLIFILTCLIFSNRLTEELNKVTFDYLGNYPIEIRKYLNDKNYANLIVIISVGTIKIELSKDLPSNYWYYRNCFCQCALSELKGLS